MVWTDYLAFTVRIVQTSGGGEGAETDRWQRSGHGREAFAEGVDRRLDIGVGVREGGETGFEGRRCEVNTPLEHGAMQLAEAFRIRGLGLFKVVHWAFA